MNNGQVGEANQFHIKIPPADPYNNHLSSVCCFLSSIFSFFQIPADQDGWHDRADKLVKGFWSQTFLEPLFNLLAALVTSGYFLHKQFADLFFNLLVLLITSDSFQFALYP